ncbi:hypothetical protein [Actinoplanes utahensis]|uniref:Uncharacterized protein n=1 Tax=Actinoplanes utahensis TaxID=1869 RepID=A0A0A6UG16_ACTUT|nr:hypothetical protein [Actinoplanes utahensis]KHD74381.1 hypothetical protein MB27_28975 [Actinoplanes utahensis]GIF31027.1 hypothetical protein Aut01nite_40130 [Actinoplanes utahensis]
MSRQFRYRMAALGLSGLIFGLPLLANGTASAEQVEANDRQVSFGGTGVLGLSCGSKPSIESMTVPASSVVRVVNQTGHDAQLRLAGAPRGTIPADGAAEVVFRRGTTAVMLAPDCAQGAEGALPVLVTAAPSASSEQPDTTPVPLGGAASTLMSKPAGPGSPSRVSAGSALPDSIAPAERPARTPSKDSRRGARRPAESRPAVASRTVTTAAQALPNGAVPGGRLKNKIVRGTAGIGAPAFAGMPPGDQKTILPGTSAASPVAPRAGGTSPAGSRTASPYPAVPPADLPLPDVATSEPTALGAAEPVAAVGRIEEGHPLGLLGLTAVVCVLGVATAAIRAIVSQRASRANMT